MILRSQQGSNDSGSEKPFTGIRTSPFWMGWDATAQQCLFGVRSPSEQDLLTVEQCLAKRSRVYK